MNKFKNAIAIVVLFVLVSHGDGQEVAWNLKVGDRFDVTMEQESVVTSDFKKIVREIGTNVVVQMHWDVIAVDGVSGVMTVKQTITGISMVMKTPTDEGSNEIVVDSSAENGSGNAAAKEMWKQVQPLISATFDVRLQPDGQVLSVDADAKTKETLRNANGSMKLRKLISPEGLTELFGRSIPVLPKATFQANETWTTNRTAETEMGAFETEDKFTFEGDAERDGRTLQRLTVSSLTSQTDESDNKNKLESSKGAGELFFDSEMGAFSFSEFSSEFSFARSYRNAVISTTTKSVIRMKIVGQ